MASRVRFSEHVPPLREVDARRLAGLAPSWEARVDPSAALAIEERARAVVASLRSQRRVQEAAELERATVLLERVDELHDHAQSIETLTQLYRALRTLAPEAAQNRADDAVIEASIGWLQSGALESAAPTSAHGPAFRATAALRSRAFRLVESMLARLSPTSACRPR